MTEPSEPALTIPLELAESLVQDEECSFDHRGGCQAHGYLSLQPGELCPQHELKQRIATAIADLGETFR